MDDLRTELAAACKKLRLSASLAERAMTQEGVTNQEYLLKLLQEEDCQKPECGWISLPVQTGTIPYR